MLVGAVVVRRSGNSVRLMMDAVAPGLLLAQAIGRWGNWWNQELYGKHTTLPWALEIHGKGAANTYHPTFLYEFLWDLFGVLLLLWIDRRFKLRRPGALRALRRRLHGVPHVRGDAADRPVEPPPGASGSTSGSRSSCFVASVAFFVWWQFVRDTAEGPTAPKPRSAAADAEGRRRWPSRVGASGSAGTVGP